MSTGDLLDGVKDVGKSAGKSGGGKLGPASGFGAEKAEKISPDAPSVGSGGASRAPKADRIDADAPSVGGSGYTPGKDKKSLTDRALAGGGGQKNPDEEGDFGDKAKEEVKNAVKPSAENAKEMASDIKDIASASKDAGVTESLKEVEKGREKAGAKGAAAAAGREAAGHAVAGAVDVATLGAGAEAHGVIQKTVSKGLKKENLIRIGLIFLVPVILVGVLLFALIYIVANPYQTLLKVLTDESYRSYTAQASRILGPSLLNGAQALGKAGYVDYHPGSAIAAPATTPKAGSLLDKFTKINIDIAKYQTLPPDCPYTFTTKEVVNVQGQKTTVIDKVFSRNTGKEVDSDNSVVLFCVADLFPLNGVMIRSPEAREVNKFSNTHLNYADPVTVNTAQGEGSAVNANNPTGGQAQTSGQNSALNGSQTQIDKFVYDKTYNNITNKENEVPKINVDQNVQDYIAKVREALVKGTDPYAVDSDFQYTGAASTNETYKTINTMCDFSLAFMLPDNLRASINSRFNTGSRSGVKSATLADTRKGYGVSANELNATFQQMDNWAASRAYGQVVDRTQTGEAANPESLSNTAYGGGFDSVYRLLFDTVQQCIFINNNDSNVISKVIGNIKSYANIINDYNELKKIIIAQSNGKFTNPDDFGLQQLMIGIIRSAGGSAVSGLEPGPWNFNNQSQGVRQLYSQYMLRIGGRFLTAEEQAQLAIDNENTRRDIEQRQGIAYRLFNTDNIHSLTSQLMARAPRTPTELGRESSQLARSLSNPIKMMADLQGSVSYIALGKTNQAFAAANYGDAYFRIDTVAFPASESQGKDIFANSDQIQDMLEKGTEDQKKVLADFDFCVKQNIPSDAYFIKDFKFENQHIVEGQYGVDKFGLPVYTFVRDKTEYQSDGESAAAREPKAEKIQWIACDILLHKSNIYDAQTKQKYFKVNNIDELARQYRLYLYSNKLVDGMVRLSSNEPDKAMYANSGGGGTPSGPGGGSAQCQTAQGNEKIPCEGLKYLGLPYDNAHSNVRVGGAEKYRQRCTDDKLAAHDPSCALDCSSFVAVMLYDAFGTAPGFAKDLALYVDVADGKIHTVNNPSLAPQYFREIKFPDEIRPGDIVTMPDHMGTVKAYDPATGKATTVESYGGSSGGPHQVDWGSIGEEGFNRAWRYIGPGATQ